MRTRVLNDVTDMPAAIASLEPRSTDRVRKKAASFNRHVLAYIHQAAEHGLYEIRGLGAKRRVPTFDDLVFLTASLSRYPLEGYREKCVTEDGARARGSPRSRSSSRFRSRSPG